MTMGIAEFFQKKSKETTIVASVVIGLCIAYLLYHAVVPTASFNTKAFFTTDDGASTFVDSADHLPPFDHFGKQAYRLTMFSMDGGKTKVAAYLERYTPEGKEKMEQAAADLKSGKIKVPPMPNPRYVEVKLPGAGNQWVNRADPAAQQIVNAKVPARIDNDSEFEIVFPS